MTPRACRPRRRSLGSVSGSRSAMVLAAVALVLGSLVGYSAGSSSAATTPGLSVTASANPPSGSTVRGGDTVTYTLTATSGQPLANGATVVDDLSGLLGNAHVLSTPDE